MNDRVEDEWPLENKAFRNISIRYILTSFTFWAILLLLLSLSIGFIIQAIAPDIFLEAAATLFPLQCVFFGLTVLALIKGVISVILSNQTAELTKPENVNVYDHEAYNFFKKDKSIADHFWFWFKQRPFYIKAIIALPLLAVLTILVLIIGYCVAPDVFSFMAPVFHFMSQCFALGIKHAGALTDLVFTPEGFLLGGQILTALTLLIATFSASLILRYALLRFFAGIECPVKPISTIEDTLREENFDNPDDLDVPAKKSSTQVAELQPRGTQISLPVLYENPFAEAPFSLSNLYENPFAEEAPSNQKSHTAVDDSHMPTEYPYKMCVKGRFTAKIISDEPDPFTHVEFDEGDTITILAENNSETYLVEGGNHKKYTILKHLIIGHAQVIAKDDLKEFHKSQVS